MANDADFAWIYAFTHHWEKGDHRPTLADVNPTHDGVTQRFWDAAARKYGWRSASVFDLTDDEVLGVFRLIWVQSKAVQCPRLIAAVHFDCSVNMSGPRANAILQRALGVTADGVLGPRSLAAAQTKDAAQVARRAIGFREAEYKQLAEDVPRLAPNLAGWLNRCTDLRRYVNLPS